MTRKEIESLYDVDDYGIIRSPGKFESEMIYVPYFWDHLMNGFSEETIWDCDIPVERFIIREEDIREFPELKEFKLKSIDLWESDTGFVNSHINS